MANAHKRINHIDKLVVGDQELVEPADIKKEIVDFYKELYMESESWRPSFIMDQCPSINAEEQQSFRSLLEKRKYGGNSKLVLQTKLQFQLGIVWASLSNAGKL